MTAKETASRQSKSLQLHTVFFILYFLAIFGFFWLGCLAIISHNLHPFLFIFSFAVSFFQIYNSAMELKEIQIIQNEINIIRAQEEVENVMAYK